MSGVVQALISRESQEEKELNEQRASFAFVNKFVGGTVVAMVHLFIWAKTGAFVFICPGRLFVLWWNFPLM